MLNDISFAIGGATGVVAFFVLVGCLRKLFWVCPPDQILVVTGTTSFVNGRQHGFRIQHGGWTIVIPYIQRVQALDLNIIPIAVRVDDVNSANGITVSADATACVCIDVEDQSLLYAAVERLMGKSRADIQEQIQQTMVGNFRGALNKTTPLQAIGMEESVDESHSGTTVDADRERAQFRSELLNDSSEDLSTFGMRVVSVSLQKIWDTSSYIANLANKTLSRKRQEVEVEEARLRARAEQAESDATRRKTVAHNIANEKILAAKGELELARRQCEAQIERAGLESENKVAKAISRGERAVQEVTVELQKLKNVSDVTLEASVRLAAATVVAEGQSEAVHTIAAVRNELLRGKTELAAAGREGLLALFVQQRLAPLLEMYAEHAGSLEVDEVLIMDDERGVNGIVNRGPNALLDFLEHLDTGFGIRLRDLTALDVPTNAAQEVKR